MAVKMLKEVETEVTNLLSDLIKINTTNPPGNETEAAKYLAETLEKEGLKCEILESAPGRGNVITRIRGTGEKPVFFCCHILTWFQRILKSGV